MQRTENPPSVKLPAESKVWNVNAEDVGVPESLISEGFAGSIVQEGTPENIPDVKLRE